ncbi:MAG: NADH-quinone oxidoreductase subunit 5 family protein [Leadbetterella sp.]
MNQEVIVFFNLAIYIIGFFALFAVKNSLFKNFSNWFVVLVLVLGVIFTSGLQSHISEGNYLSYSWISIGKTQVNFELRLEPSTYFLQILVQVIAFMVVIFSGKYLRDDRSINRFYAYICLFVFCMLGLVLAGNLFQFYFFWELVGFVSFLLVGFWYKKKAPSKASFMVFITNKIGDVLFLLGIFLVYSKFQSASFSSFADAKSLVPSTTLNVASLLMFVGVMSKSAQFPLQIWLPRAMEGPTPASALIHAATMVVAGVLLLGPINTLFGPEVRLFIAIVGSSTALLAALTAVFQNELKSVLAYSTISQLGFMVAGMGVGALGASYFHLVTHAFFKAGLFLGAGAVMDIFHHEKDMRKMGGLAKKQPFLFYSFCICAASLIGVPFSSGFISKESLVVSALDFCKGDFWSVKVIVPVCMILTSFVTALYVIRMVVMTFIDRKQFQFEKIIETTKKTLDGAKKSFENILSGEKQTVNSGLWEFLKSSGAYELVLGFFAICSLFILFSIHPLGGQDIWFFAYFGEPSGHYEWLPYLMIGLVLLALLISYNVTYSELKYYYIGNKSKGWRSALGGFIASHYGIEKAYSKLYKFLVFSYDSKSKGVGGLGILPRFSRRIETGILDKAITGITTFFLLFSRVSLLLDKAIFDRAVVSIYTGIYGFADTLRKLNRGHIQGYLLGMIGVLIILVLTFLFN